MAIPIANRPSEILSSPSLSEVLEIYSRENESIPIEPVRVAGIERHEFVEHDMGNRCHAHGSTWMPRVGFDCCIDLSKHQKLRIEGHLGKPFLLLEFPKKTLGLPQGAG